MAAPLIVGIGGTTRAGSTSERAMQVALEHARTLGCETLAFGAGQLPQTLYVSGRSGGHPEAQGGVHGDGDRDEPGRRDGSVRQRIDGGVDRHRVEPARPERRQRPGQRDRLVAEFVTPHQQHPARAAQARRRDTCGRVACIGGCGRG